MHEWLGHRRRLLTPYRQAVRHRKKDIVMAGFGALRNWRGAAQFPESKDKLSRKGQRRHGRR